MRPGSQKINAVINALEPTDIKELRSFLGLANYFRKFIKGFAKIVAPLTELLRKDIKWKWGNEQTKSVQELKRILTNRPMLVLYDPTLETELNTDASSVKLGAMLLQKRDGEKRVVSYYSRKTTLVEKNYHSYDLETLAIVEALKAFPDYLIGIKFTVVTDCFAIRSTAVKRDINHRVGRWWARKTTLMSSLA